MLIAKASTITVVSLGITKFPRIFSLGGFSGNVNALTGSADILTLSCVVVIATYIEQAEGEVTPTSSNGEGCPFE
jgi:hypothetical protein